MPSVLIAKEDGIVLLDFELQPGRTYTIGRLKSSDICLDAKSVSRAHAILYNRGDRWLMTDLGSTKGLRSETGVVRDLELVHEGWVAIGPAIMWFFDERSESRSETDGDHEAAASERSSPEGEAPVRTQEVLDIVHAGTGHRTGVLLGTRSILLGTDPDCTITLEGPEIAPVHAIVFRKGSHWSVATVNDTPLRGSDGAACGYASLTTGQCARVGPLELSLIEAVKPVHPRISRENADGEDDPFLVDDPLDLDLDALAEQSPGRPDRPSR